MRMLTPAQLEAFTGLTTASQRNWRSLGLFDEIGTSEEGKHTRYHPLDALLIAVARDLNRLGVELDVAVKLAAKLSVAHGMFGEILGHTPVSAPQTDFILVVRKEAATERLESFMGTVSGRKHLAVGFSADQPLESVSEYSREGGLLVPLAGLLDRIPQAVRDLFADDDE